MTEYSSIATWDKAKDAALIGFLALASAALIKLMTDVNELKTQLAVYQANVADIRKEQDRMRDQIDAHFREDKEYQKSERKR